MSEVVIFVRCPPSSDTIQLKKPVPEKTIHHWLVPTTVKLLSTLSAYYTTSGAAKSSQYRHSFGGLLIFDQSHLLPLIQSREKDILSIFLDWWVHQS